MTSDTKERVEQVDEAFCRQLASAIGKVLTQTKRRKNPMAREWDWGIRTFLVGGGSHCTAYRSAVLAALKRIRTPLKEMHFELLELENRDQFGAVLLHRLSVAYGLTFGADSIGEAITPDEIEDIGGQAEQEARPDRDDLYPK